jgi:hypothetical protein
MLHELNGSRFKNCTTLQTFNPSTLFIATLQHFNTQRFNASVRRGPDRIGLLGKPPAAQFCNLQEPVAVLAFLCATHLMSGMKQYECGHTQPLFRVGHGHGKTSGVNPKG